MAMSFSDDCGAGALRLTTFGAPPDALASGGSGTILDH